MCGVHVGVCSLFGFINEYVMLCIYILSPSSLLYIYICIFIEFIFVVFLAFYIL